MGHWVFYQNKRMSVKNSLQTSAFDGFLVINQFKAKHMYLSNSEKIHLDYKAHSNMLQVHWEP